MSRSYNKLTAKEVDSITRTGRHSDGGSLYLNVSKDGSKSWVFIYTLNKRKREMGLGAYVKPYLLRKLNRDADTQLQKRKKVGKSLDEARHLAGQYRALIADGTDPFEYREAVKAEKLEQENNRILFGDIIEDYISKFVERRKVPNKDSFTGFSNPKHRYQWTMTLRVYAKPLHHLSPKDITKLHIYNVLKEIWVTKHVTAKRTRQRIEKVWGFAKSQGFCDGDNPAVWKDNLEHDLVPLTPKSVTNEINHLPSMHYSEVPNFMANLRKREADTARLLELIILTATRSQEARHAKWGEFDLVERNWTIPAVRMKNRTEHIIPLSDRAVELLQNIKSGETSEFVFLNPTYRKPFSDNAPRLLLKRMKAGHTTTHGFRSSFRSYAAEQTDFSFNVMEAALSHKYLTAVQAAYDRSNLLEKRRALMQSWADFLSKKHELD